MEPLSSRFWLIVAALAASTFSVSANHSPQPVPTIDLSSSKEEYVYIDKDAVLEYAGGGLEEWNFRSTDEHPIYLYFTAKYQSEFLRRRWKCYSFITVSDSNGLDIYSCETPLRLYTSTNIRVQSTKFQFQAFVSKRPQVPGICDFGTGNAGVEPPLVIYTMYPATDKGIQMRDVHFTNLGAVLSTQIVLLGENIGSTPCTQPNNILFPTSDVPSCHADFKKKCLWSTTAPVEKASSVNQDTNVTGDVFVLNDSRHEFNTKLSYHLDRICFLVEYISRAPVRLELILVQKHFGNKDVTRRLLSSTNLNPALSWTVERIVEILPDGVVGQIVVRLNGSSAQPVFLKKLYGCNPDERVERFNADSSVGDPVVMVNYISKNLTESEDCLHGGKMSSDGCSCLEGFTGRHCEIGCGDNRFGPNCEGRCSYDDMKCKYKVLCKQNIGCRCAPGWKGIACNSMCEINEYGAGCREDCGRCKGSRTCDRFTGSCKNGCQHGYVPPLCKSKYIHITKRPLITDIQHSFAVLRLEFNREDLSGEGVPTFFRIHYSEVDSKTGAWKTSPLFPVPSDRRIVKKFGPMKAGKKYTVKVVVFDSTMTSYNGTDIPSVELQTLCKESDLNITVKDVEMDKATLEWKIVEIEDGCKFETFEVQILMGYTWEKYTTPQQSMTVDWLLPGTEYTVRIRQLNYIHPQPYFYAKFVTISNITGEVNDLRITKTNERSATLSWNTKYNNLSGFTIAYKCLTNLEDENEDCSHDTGMLQVYNNSAIVKNLHPFRLYQFQVKQSPGNTFSETSGTTKESEPGAPDDFRVLNKTDTSFSARFHRPGKANGIIRQFQIRVVQSDWCETSSAECTAERQVSIPAFQPDENEVKDLYYFKVEKLIAGSNITVTLKARTTVWGQEAGPITFKLESAKNTEVITEPTNTN